MKSKLICFLLANVFILQAQANCTSIDDKSEKLANDSLEAIGELNKCTYKPVKRIVSQQQRQSLEERIRAALTWGDEVSAQKKNLARSTVPDAFRKYLMNETSSPEKQRHHRLVAYPNPPFKSTVNPPARDYSSFDRSHIDGYFQQGMVGLKESPEIREKIKEKIIEKFVLTPDRYNKPECIPRIDEETELIAIRPMGKNEDKYNMKKYSSEISDYMVKRQYTNDFATDLRYCNPEAVLGTPKASKTVITPEDCHISLTHNFPPNVSALNREEFLAKNKEQIGLLNQCIKRNVDKGFVLEKVQINSSTDASLNSGDYLGKPFEVLSQDRSDSVKKLKDDIIDPSVVTISDAMIEANIKGSNGDGSSGPCPYDADGTRTDWYEHTHPVSKNATAEEKELLEQFNNARYVSMYAIFKNESKEESHAPTDMTQSLSLKCFNLRISCE